jgi:hypothetical protein
MARDLRNLFGGDGKLAGFNVYINGPYRADRAGGRQRQNDGHAPVKALGYDQFRIATAQQITNLVGDKAPGQPPGDLCRVIDGSRDLNRQVNLSGARDLLKRGFHSGSPSLAFVSIISQVASIVNSEVENVMVEIKARSQVAPEDYVQALNYVKASGFKLGLLLNFGAPRLQIKRLVAN